MPNSVGYSGTPLAKKPGLKPGSQVLVTGAPDNYQELIASAPDAISYSTEVTPTTDLVHIFTTDRAVLSVFLRDARAMIRADAIIWVSWPKKGFKVPTDITEDTIREICLPLGLVHVKVCAVSEA